MAPQDFLGAAHALEMVARNCIGAAVASCKTCLCADVSWITFGLCDFASSTHRLARASICICRLSQQIWNMQCKNMHRSLVLALVGLGMAATSMDFILNESSSPSLGSVLCHRSLVHWTFDLLCKHACLPLIACYASVCMRCCLFVCCCIPQLINCIHQLLSISLLN